jgi:hypothetical protein
MDSNDVTSDSQSSPNREERSSSESASSSDVTSTSLFDRKGKKENLSPMKLKDSAQDKVAMNGETHFDQKNSLHIPVGVKPRGTLKRTKTVNFFLNFEFPPKKLTTCLVTRKGRSFSTTFLVFQQMTKRTSIKQRKYFIQSFGCNAFHIRSFFAFSQDVPDGYTVVFTGHSKQPSLVKYMFHQNLCSCLFVSFCLFALSNKDDGFLTKEMGTD